jgi:hypothetical protein
LSLTEEKINELLRIRKPIERIELEVAWAAGLFEGEGSVYVCKVGDRTRAGVELSSTDEDVILKFVSIIGFGKIAKRERPPHKTHWRWYLYNRDEIIEVIELLLPYLGERRTIDAEKALAKAKETRNYRGPR